MLRIPCPWCGERDEIEFRYRGDATKVRPDPQAGIAAFSLYVYERGNPCGWHVEWWLHVGGCRSLLKVLRHTLTHEISWVGGPQDQPPLPPSADG
ncbi:MAG TPA: sarcosine oxidase subunit delta [Steroidobacteraceae bacterium]|jgi:sarcosine oxidase subunit delta|nr:sarcosine oxidase subunit delta [Steroidobacteraceae bacterium]